MPPLPPGEESWKFVEELRYPEPLPQRWSRRHSRRGEADLTRGIRLQWDFPDPHHLLETARESLARYGREKDLSLRGDFPVIVHCKLGLSPEAFCIEVTQEQCLISAGDTEGIRRAIYWLQDQLSAADGPFLKCGVIHRSPEIRTRISRCFFGPIKRPPAHRDELADEVNYYPEAYLERLAHDGVNGLWLTISFRDLCPSRFFPGFGVDHQRRLAKLRKTVERCARYGIGIYAFCIEPQGFGESPEFLHPLSYLEENPELRGHRDGDFLHFCTSTETGIAYLEEAAEFLFRQVPGLAGLIDINMGERPTHCYSSMLWDKGPNNCPRCSKRKSSEVFHDTLASLQRGMRRASSAAKLISWLYIPNVHRRQDRPVSQFVEEVVEIAKAIPKGVTLQLNFESLGEEEQLGRRRTICDYSLAYVGPSAFFEKVAQAVSASGNEMGAKLQVGCSHEVATAPWVPVPENLYLKYRELHRLGVSTVMQCWYFGNYPSLMTRAAGALAFAPLEKQAASFLQELAGPVWGRKAPQVAKAWRALSAGYRQFPANLHFAWYGPLHDSVVWPLYLWPEDRPITPSWLLTDDPCGDRIGECLGAAHTLEEALQLCRSMRKQWQKGLDLLGKPRASNHPAANAEIAVATALGIQISSACNVLEFYQKRERLYRIAGRSLQFRLLRRMEALVKEEIAHSSKLARLADRDSRLGFHSEAEGYKYFPAKLRWRCTLLRKLLKHDFPQLKAQIAGGIPLAPAYTGQVPEGPGYLCKREPLQLAQEIVQGEGGPWETRWRAIRDGDRLQLEVDCTVPPAHPEAAKRSPNFPGGDYLRLAFEPRRLWPLMNFYIGRHGQQSEDQTHRRDPCLWQATCVDTATGWRARIVLPLKALKPTEAECLRFNLIRVPPSAPRVSWIEEATLPPRLIFGADHPKALGWFHFAEP